jgi:hypothetical protein
MTSAFPRQSAIALALLFAWPPNAVPSVRQLGQQPTLSIQPDDVRSLEIPAVSQAELELVRQARESRLALSLTLWPTGGNSRIGLWTSTTIRALDLPESKKPFGSWSSVCSNELRRGGNLEDALEIDARVTFKWSRRAICPVSSCRSGALLFCDVRRAHVDALTISPNPAGALVGPRHSLSASTLTKSQNLRTFNDAEFA